MHKSSKNIDASSKYLGPDVYKRSKVHTEVQQSWSDLYVTVIRRLLRAACKLIHVFVRRGKETVVIMRQLLAPSFQHVLEQTTGICAPLVYMTFGSTHPLENPVWCGMSWSRNEHMVLLDSQNTSTHTHTQTPSVSLWTPHWVHTKRLLWGLVFLLTGGNLSGTFSFNRHLGGEFIEEMPTDADVGDSGWSRT
jgi:hypothetical protein